MTRLKYIEASVSRSDDADSAESGARTFRFPGAVRDVLSAPDPRRMAPDDLTRSIDATLDRMQESLNALAEDVNDSYRFEDFRADDSNDPGPNSAA